MTLSLSANSVFTLGCPTITLIIATCFFCLWQFFDRRSYLGLLALAFLLHASGTAMRALQWPNNVELNAVLSVALHLMSVGCMAEGVLRRYGRRAQATTSALCLVVWVLVVYFHYAQQDTNAHAYFLNLGICVILGMTAWRIRQASRATKIDRTVFWIFLLFTLGIFLGALLMLPWSLTPGKLGRPAMWQALQWTLGLTQLMLAPALLGASLVKKIVRLRNDQDLDSLTGLLNRRALNERLHHLIEHENTDSYALLLIDFDHFKSINECYGHGVGDTVLCSFAGLIRDCTGPNALAARVGGEEFAIVVRADLTIAKLLMQRLHDLLRKTRIPGIDDDHSITVSTGLAMLQMNDTIPTWMQRADARLYQAKRASSKLIAPTTAPKCPQNSMARKLSLL